MLVVSLSSLAISSWPTNTGTTPLCTGTYSSESSMVKDDDGWILIGEVSLHTRNTYWDEKHEHLYYYPDIKANLYVREIAHSVIYRIGYGGKYYAVKSCYKSDGTIECYQTVIGEITYTLVYK